MMNFWLRMMSIVFSSLGFERDRYPKTGIAAFRDRARWLSAAVISFVVRMLGDAPGTDHLDVVVHQPPRASGVAHLDQRGELAVHVEHAARDLRRQRAVLGRPGDVLQRDQL